MSLAAQGVRVVLGGTPVLDGIDVAFRPGRVTALLGPNGAGKSTLLDCLAGLRVPNAGGVTLDGADVAKLGARGRAQAIGLLPQGGEAHWNVDVRTLVALGRFPHQGRWGETDEDRAAVERAMAAVDVAALAERGVEHLSGGERGRALLARLLAGEPRWLLADEPLANLDPAHQLDVLARLRDVAVAGSGVVVVLHDLHLAARAADDAVLLRGGRIVAAGPAVDVLTSERIEEAYGVAVEIGTTATGRRYVLPYLR